LATEPARRTRRRLISTSSQHERLVTSGPERLALATAKRTKRRAQTATIARHGQQRLECPAVGRIPCSSIRGDVDKSLATYIACKLNGVPPPPGDPNVALIPDSAERTVGLVIIERCHGVSRLPHPPPGEAAPLRSFRELRCSPESGRWKFRVDPCQTARLVEHVMAVSE
jgi:hypothetical protein